MYLPLYCRYIVVVCLPHSLPSILYSLYFHLLHRHSNTHILFTHTNDLHCILAGFQSWMRCCCSGLSLWSPVPSAPDRESQEHHQTPRSSEDHYHHHTDRRRSREWKHINATAAERQLRTACSNPAKKNKISF